MDVLEVGYSKGTLAGADGDRTFHRRDVAQYLGGTPIALTKANLHATLTSSWPRWTRSVAWHLDIPASWLSCWTRWWRRGAVPSGSRWW